MNLIKKKGDIVSEFISLYDYFNHWHGSIQGAGYVMQPPLITDQLRCAGN